MDVGGLAGQAAQDGEGTVAGAIVDENHPELEMVAEERADLLQFLPESLDGPFLIEDRHHDIEAFGRGGHERVTGGEWPRVRRSGQFEIDDIDDRAGAAEKRQIHGNLLVALASGHDAAESLEGTFEDMDLASGDDFRFDLDAGIGAEAFEAADGPQLLEQLFFLFGREQKRAQDVVAAVAKASGFVGVGADEDIAAEHGEQAGQSASMPGADFRAQRQVAVDAGPLHKVEQGFFLVGFGKDGEPAASGLFFETRLKGFRRFGKGGVVTF